MAEDQEEETSAADAPKPKLDKKAMRGKPWKQSNKAGPPASAPAPAAVQVKAEPEPQPEPRPAGEGDAEVAPMQVDTVKDSWDQDSDAEVKDSWEDAAPGKETVLLYLLEFAAVMR